MADQRNPGRFRPTRREPSAPQPAATAPTAPAAQATKDIEAVSTFIGRVSDARSQAKFAPTPRPMSEVLGQFRGNPAAQTRIQVLAAAGAARHFHAESEQARRWEKLAQDNAVRQARIEARQTQAGRPQEQIAADEKLVFDAAGAVALSYVAAKSLPPYVTLDDLSREHLTGAEVAGQAPQPERTTTEGAELGERENTTPKPTTENVDAVSGPAEDADVSDALEEVTPSAQPEARNDLGGLSEILQSAGRGIAAAAGPVQGDDDVAPPLSPVDLNKVTQELLGAIGSAMKSHPRSVTEMLNADRQPDHTNADAFVPDMGAERGPELVAGY